MEITPELRRLVHLNAPAHELRAKVRQQGMLTLREEGVVLAIDGEDEPGGDPAGDAPGR